MLSHDNKLFAKIQTSANWGPDSRFALEAIIKGLPFAVYYKNITLQNMVGSNYWRRVIIENLLTMSQVESLWEWPLNSFGF